MLTCCFLSQYSSAPPRLRLVNHCWPRPANLVHHQNIRLRGIVGRLRRRGHLDVFRDGWKLRRYCNRRGQSGRCIRGPRTRISIVPTIDVRLWWRGNGRQDNTYCAIFDEGFSRYMVRRGGVGVPFFGDALPLMSLDPVYVGSRH